MLNIDISNSENFRKYFEFWKIWFLCQDFGKMFSVFWFIDNPYFIVKEIMLSQGSTVTVKCVFNALIICLLFLNIIFTLHIDAFDGLVAFFWSFVIFHVLFFIETLFFWKSLTGILCVLVQIICVHFA